MGFRKGHRFNNNWVSTPGVYSKTTSNMLDHNTDGAKNIAILGEAEGGRPGELYVLSSPEEAKEIFKGGELLTGILKAYNPVIETKLEVELGGADRIFAIRTNEATKATKEFGETEKITFMSKDFGAINNNIEISLYKDDEDKKVDLIVRDNGGDEHEVFNNVGDALVITYDGEETAILTIKEEKGKKSLTIAVGENATAVNADLNKDRLKTLRELEALIESYDGFKCDVADGYNIDLTVEDLDIVENLELAKNVPTKVTAILKGLEKITKYQSKLIDIENNIKRIEDLPVIEKELLEGGEDKKSPISWIKYLDELGRFDIDYIVPLTSDPAIIAEAKAHVLDMSATKGKERRLVAGGGANQTAKEAINFAHKIASDRVQYVGFGGYDYDKTLMPGYILAAMHAGRAAFLGVESCTGDIYNFMTPVPTFGPVERQDLINNGVLFFDEKISDYNHKMSYAKLVWDYTTYAEKNDPLLVERSTGAISDQLSKEVRADLEKFLTGKLTPTGVLESARNRVLSILKDYQKREIILEYRNVFVKKHYDRTDIHFEVAPTQVNNFTFVNVLFYNKDIELEEV